MPHRVTSGQSGLSMLWRHFRGEWTAVAFFSLVANLILLVPTIYMLQVYDRVMVSGSLLTLLAVSLIALLMFAFMAFADIMRARLLVRMGARMDSAVADRIFTASVKCKLYKPGSTAAQPLTDWSELRQFLTGPAIVTLFDLPWTPVYVVTLFLLHPLLGVVAIGFALIQAAIAWLGHQRIVAPAKAYAQAQQQSMHFLQGKLRNTEAIEAMGMFNSLRRLWLQQHAINRERHAKLHGLTHLVSGFSKYIRYAQQAGSLAAGALLVIDGQLSPGAMIAANILMARALAPIDQLVGVWRGLVNARSAYHQLDVLLRHDPIPDAPHTASSLRGDVLVRDLSVLPTGCSSPVLRKLNFEAPSGSMTVILGASGSGKSTLARVLSGCLPQYSHSVLLDGTPLPEWENTLRGTQVGYLPQDTALFHGTVAENIARFGPVDAQKVVAAAQCAGLHDMVLKFPKGYETQVGERGNMLSGGQRQRIGLARALYGEPSMIILDEPNAHLDDVGEAALLDGLRQLKSRRATVFLVTHRAGVISLADQLLVLKEGELHKYGPREQVLQDLRSAPALTVPDTPTRPQPVPA